jgi:ring-1,2-phenylacetyl-CoA epoxidase subunit PaaE
MTDRPMTDRPMTDRPMTDRPMTDIPTTDTHFHPLRIAERREEGKDAVVLGFELPPSLADAYRFEPGQHLTLRRRPDHAGEGDAGQDDLRRSYSICAAPGEPLRVGIRRVPGGVFSTWACDRLRVGDAVEVLPPQGRFGAALAEPAGEGGRHILALAGGSGITPILSILRSVLATEPASRCTLLYANRTLASTMFRDELLALKSRHIARFALHPVFSRESVDLPLQAGRLDAAHIARLLPLAGGAGAITMAFVCGPHAFNDEAEAALRAAGVDATRIHVERFGIPPALQAATGSVQPHEARAGDATQARIAIVRDGATRELAWAEGDESLLATGRRAGLDLPYSCRSGVCATCRAKVIEGRVRMDRNFALEPAEVAAGWVLACQSHPLTERVLLSFDAR